jgi:pimeloyl-ACP methyl ester carboxylesterase
MTMDAQIVDIDTGSATLACTVTGAGPTVILAHGFPDCARSFRHQVHALVAAGFRTVVPNMRGYAPSSTARDGRYDPATIGADLVALARVFSPDAPARLVGHDWGAVAAYAACALAPRAFSHLCAVAVPPLRTAGLKFLHPAQLRRSWYVGLFQLPYVAERRLAADDFALVDRLWRDWSPGFTPPAAELAAVKDAMRGRVPDVLAYYRSLRKRDAGAAARRLLLAPIGVPGVYIHGRDDGCCGVALSDGAERAFTAPATVHRLAGGHFVHQENSEQFNRVLLDFLKRPMQIPVTGASQIVRGREDF